ncbi:MAG: GNAT family N-acetyltransferase [Acidimicrobiales bacterium]
MLEIRPPTEADRAGIAAVGALAFNMEARTEGVNFDSRRRLCSYDGERVVAIAHSIAFGQWLGGQQVPCAGIGAVAVLPEYRGQGAARALVSELLAEERGNGMAVSALYPAMRSCTATSVTSTPACTPGSAPLSRTSRGPGPRWRRGAVLPEYRGQGLARALVGELLARERHAGVAVSATDRHFLSPLHGFCQCRRPRHPGRPGCGRRATGPAVGAVRRPRALDA